MEAQSTGYETTQIMANKTLFYMRNFLGNT